jgi:ribosome assembly protein YihI (activator of Der GTPase)
LERCATGRNQIDKICTQKSYTEAHLQSQLFSRKKKKKGWGHGSSGSMFKVLNSISSTTKKQQQKKPYNG